MTDIAKMKGDTYKFSLHKQLSHSKIISNADPNLRVYQAWKGNNVFCLGGRLIFGPDMRSILLTLFLILIPVIMFAVFVSQSLVHEFHHHFGQLILCICVVFTAYVVFLLFLTSARDPGIIPRNAHPPEEDGSNGSSNWPGFQVGGPTLPLTKEVVVNGITVKVKYCQTCMLYRPPRCSHCSVCNNCVEHFDHHCPWVGQCIGKRNYRFFFMFVSSTTLLCLFIFSCCWVNIRRIMAVYHCNTWGALLKSPVSGILILYTFISAWFVGGLTTFHLYLIFTNQTTYENFRYRYDKKTNPYNTGCIRNIIGVFFSKMPKSKNNFRAKINHNPPTYPPTVPVHPSRILDVSKSGFESETNKRKAVSEEDFEDIQKQIGIINGIEGLGARQGCADRGSEVNPSPDAADMETKQNENLPEVASHTNA